MVKSIVIGYDHFLNKPVKKIVFEPNELPKLQLFNPDEVISGNPSSNIAICFVYTWKDDNPPKEIMLFAQKVSNYAALTGYWRTTNGGRYAFSNILANPNINKLVVLVFGGWDNGHLLAESLAKFWENGIDQKGIIIGSKSPNPKFEQVPREGLERVRKQADLLVLRELTGNDFERIENIIKSLYQEPKNARPADNIEFYSNHISNKMLYDDGARFDEPYKIDLSVSAKKISFIKKDLAQSLGHCIHAKNLSDAIESTASFLFEHGSEFIDERGITNLEIRSFTLIVMDPLEEIPEGFDPKYIEKYVDEFMSGLCEKDFEYTYHNRIFKKWENQVDGIIKLLKAHPNTRRAIISLWDQLKDLNNKSPPCLDMIWFVIRDDKLELHCTYRSHHLATITKTGKLMRGEGALVPNLYALGTLQKYVAESLNITRGPLVLNDFSGHLYVNYI